jgi:hypothetical protein
MHTEFRDGNLSLCGQQLMGNNIKLDLTSCKNGESRSLFSRFSLALLHASVCAVFEMREQDTE